MPNKRANNKVSMGIYVDKEIRDMVMAALKKRGITLTDFLYQQLLQLLVEESEKVIKKLESKNGKKAKK